LYLFLVSGALYWVIQSLWLFVGGILLMMIGTSASILPDMPDLFGLSDQPLFWWWVSGLAAVDALHTLMDWFWPFR
jgi:hypothetical protein